MNLIESNLQKIVELCQRHKVKTLSVFGSILTNKFHDDSDVDLLVNFEPHDPNNSEFDYCRNYWDLQDALEHLLGKRVDLVEEGGLRNKYFIDNINRTKQQIYG